jgi:hypothetical protein
VLHLYVEAILRPLAKEIFMVTSRLEKPQWQAYFDQVSKGLAGKQAEIEVNSLKLGNQTEAEWLPFYGITYDPKNDIVEVVLEGLDHLIHKPREVFVEHDSVEMHSVEIIDQDDVRQIVRLRNPLMLASP